MIEAVSLTPETLVSLGTAVVVMSAAIKGTMVLVNIRRDLDDIRSSIVRRNEMELWIAKLERDNPNVKVSPFTD